MKVTNMGKEISLVDRDRQTFSTCGKKAVVVKKAATNPKIFIKSM